MLHNYYLLLTHWQHILSPFVSDSIHIVDGSTSLDILAPSLVSYDIESDAFSSLILFVGLTFSSPQYIYVPEFPLHGSHSIELKFPIDVLSGTAVVAVVTVVEKKQFSELTAKQFAEMNKNNKSFFILYLLNINSI